VSFERPGTGEGTRPARMAQKAKLHVASAYTGSTTVVGGLVSSLALACMLLIPPNNIRSSSCLDTWGMLPGCKQLLVDANTLAQFPMLRVHTLHLLQWQVFD